MSVRPITTSYATGRVSDAAIYYVGGLVGGNYSSITASYWDTSTSGRTGGSNGRGQTTTQLQTPTGYNGIYAAWNVDLDGNGTNDDPWDFGTASQYPALKVDFDGDGRASWQEFGYQVREGPALTATPGQDQVGLRWTAVNTNHWTPTPAVTYTVTREEGSTVETLAEGISNGALTDRTGDPAHTYQVAAVVAGGEATRSGLVPVGQTVTDDDEPVVAVSFKAAIYTVNEGAAVDCHGAAECRPGTPSGDSVDDDEPRWRDG